MQAFVASRAFANASYRPILSFEKTSLRNVPLLEVALRDPKVDLKIKDKDEAEDALDDAKDIDEDYPRAEPAEKQKLALDALRFYAALVYYLEDVELGLAKGGTALKLADMRAKVMAYAKFLIEVAKDQETKDRGRYVYLATAYAMGKEPQVAVAIKKKGAIPIDGAYKVRFELLEAFAALGDANPMLGIGLMSKVSESLDAPVPLVGALATGRALGGFDLRGRKVRGASSSYGSFLYKSAMLTEGYKGEIKDRVLSFIVNVWMQAEGEKIDWSKPPFSVQPLEGFAQMDAINERKAYRLFDAGQREEALEVFARLLPEYEESAELGKLTDRRLNMMFAVAQKSGNYDAYAQALHRAARDFKNANVMGPDAAEAAKKFSKRFHNVYQLFVLRSLKAAHAANAKAEARADAVKIGTLFVNLTDDRKEKARVLREIAEVQHLARDYAKAVESYLDVSKLVKPDQKIAYVGKAIDSQRMLAQWPKDPPWDKNLPGDEGQRKKLITLYQMTLKKKASDWRALAHMGLLHKANGSLQQAFKLWLPQLSDGTSDGNAQKAAGLMLVHYNGEKDWKDLTEAAQAIRKAKVSPTHQGKGLNVDVYLADGLYHSGEMDFKKRDYKGAIASYQAFRSLFEADKRIPEVLYKSGLAYAELKDQKKFAGSMRVVVSKHSSSPFAKDAIKKGVELSKDESDKVYFLEASLKQFPNDPNTFALREQLAKLYTGLTMHEKALRVYEAAERDKNAKPEQKIIANLRILEISEKAKDNAAAVAAADRLIKTPRIGQSPLARAYAFNVKHYLRQKQADKVDEYTALAEKITARDKEASEALAEIRYITAARAVAKLPPAPDFKVITDPTKEITTQAVGLQEYKTKIDRVCELGDTPSCTMAKKDLSVAAQKVHDNVSAINLVQGETEKQFKDFESKKKILLQAISASILKAH